jgi:hypothetical protein
VLRLTQKMDWAAYWAIFAQTRQVTLFWIPKKMPIKTKAVHSRVARFLSEHDTKTGQNVPN